STYQKTNFNLGGALTKSGYALDDVVLDFSDVSSINSINTFKLNGLVDGRLDISGLAAGTPVAVFDISGKKMASLRAGEETTLVNVGNFRSGVYILKAGTQIVKFVKR
ncbi:T9SS type A sorting domain-containing protein, partial [Prevotella pectinovora]|uniref:T9SS type A sorting domain-containing protein n=1 Tax=Prevotella pectinovora TaxID=1602169 RepID=UPI003080F3FA